MKSLVSGGVNDLTSGRVKVAGRILINAMNQVSRTQESIDSAVGKRVVDWPVMQGQGEAEGWVKAAAGDVGGSGNGGGGCGE